MKIDRYVVGQVQTNCYVVWNEDTKECFIVDPGDCAKALADRIRGDELSPKAILLTHGHFDHAQAAEELAKEFGISIYAHEAERRTLEDPSYNVSGMIGRADSYHADIFLEDEQEIDLAGFHIRVLFTPGHTEGGCCYYLPYENIVFSGDTLFCMSVGRTDFKGGGMSTLVRSIQDKLMVLPPSTVVYPGHNEETEIEYERIHNPYL